jgi:hypothetical protein
VTDIDYGSGFQTLRRFYLKKRHMARLSSEWALSSVWQSHQEEQSSPALPASFPALSDLAAAGYTTSGDLEGATEAELVEWARLTSKAARTVLAAYAAL